MLFSMSEQNNEMKKMGEIQNIMKYLSSEHGESMVAYGSFIGSVLKNGKLSLKVKELISVALSISSQCEWCITYHTKMAIDAGATEDEILEAGMVSVLMNGSPAMMHMIPLKKALDTFKK